MMATMWSHASLMQCGARAKGSAELVLYLLHQRRMQAAGAGSGPRWQPAAGVPMYNILMWG